MRSRAEMLKSRDAIEHQGKVVKEVV